MAASKQDIQNWFESGVAARKTHMIVVCDTYDWEDYPVYVGRHESVTEKARLYDGVGLQKVMEIYNLTKPMQPQLDEQYTHDTGPAVGASLAKPGLADILGDITEKVLKARESDEQKERRIAAEKEAERKKNEEAWAKQAESMYEGSVAELYEEAHKGNHKMWICQAIGTASEPSGCDRAIIRRFEEEGFEVRMTTNDTNDTVIEVLW